MKTYQAVCDRLDFFETSFEKIKAKELDENGVYFKYKSIDLFIPLIEIDIFKNEFPDTYIEYLNYFWDSYTFLDRAITKEFVKIVEHIETVDGYIEDVEEKCPILKMNGLLKLSDQIEEIVIHLNTLLGKDQESEDQDKPEINVVKNINQRSFIFTEPKHFELFEHWRGEIKKNVLAEYSFIYWQMVKDGYIYENVRPTEFINWLNKNYEIALHELKQYDNCKGGGKISRYRTAKLLFQC